MIGLEPVVELVTTVLWSGQVDGERPLSLILVAPPGAGKTSVLEDMESNISHFFSDLTSREVKNCLANKKDLTHLMLGDFLSLFGHAKGTVNLSVNLISRLTGDTIHQAPWTGEEIPPKKMGFITAIPPDDLNKRDIRSHVRSGGFASRFLIARYTYTKKTIDSVHRFIRTGEYRKQSKTILAIKPEQKIITVPKQISDNIDMMAQRIKSDPLGFRAHHHLRTLACAMARKDGRTVVSDKDYDKVVEFCDFFTEVGKLI